MNHSHSATGTHAKGGCGCGCGGGSAGRSCSCNKQECQECQTPALVRPRFFAGQLLTEDDLEALTTYVVAKQRLHTRHLHGAGVVCGLEVVCHPCDHDQVIVQPGYALDCCGNDISVPCASELDILSMIRRLQLEKGFDCGDPCQEPTTRPQRAAAGPSASTNVAGVPTRDDTRTVPDPKQPASRKYCLYVRYCEQGADPVKPYVLQEPCGDGASCEHTRVREGYRFELRCEEEMTPPQTILDRIKMCAEPEELQKEIAGAEMRRARYEGLERALYLAKQPEAMQFTAEDTAQFTLHQDTVAGFAKQFPSGDVEEGAPSIDETQLRKTIDAYTSLARIATKARIAAAEGGEVPPELLKRTEQARITLQEAEPLLRERVNVFTNTEDLLLSKAALAEGLRWTAPDLAADQRTSTAAKLFMGGALQTRDISTYDLQQLSQLRDWLRRRIGPGMQTDCRLRKEVESIRIDPEIAGNEEALAALRRRLDAALQRYVAACFCLALLPPCPPCDDTAVLLACLTVENCEVVDICNLERTFVLSWPAMRYWVPWFGQIGEMFEDLCCPSEIEKKDRSPQTRKTYMPYDRPPLPGMAPPGAMMTMGGAGSNLLTKTGELSYSLVHRAPIEGALRFVAPTPASAGTVARLTQVLEGSIAPVRGELPTAVETAVAPQGDQLADALRSAAPRRVINDLIAERVEEMRPPRDLTLIAETVNERIATVNTTIADVRKELRRRPTATELTETKAVKRLVAGTTELKDTNRRLEKANQELAARVDALLERVDRLEAR